MSYRSILSFAAILACAAPLSSTAQAATRVGVLQCNVGAGVGIVITSTRALSCVFRPARGPSERYFGTVRRFGLDLGVTSAGRLGWFVLAPSRPGPGALAGGYVGASGSIAAGVGVGANALVGGFNNSFALQPFSIEGQRGINIAAGIGALDLIAARPRRR